MIIDDVNLSRRGARQVLSGRVRYEDIDPREALFREFYEELVAPLSEAGRSDLADALRVGLGQGSPLPRFAIKAKKQYWRFRRRLRGQEHRPRDAATDPVE